MFQHMSYETAKEFAWEIVECFEGLLEEKGIDIPSDDRTGDESEARLYGSEYYDLCDHVIDVLLHKHLYVRTEEE